MAALAGPGSCPPGYYWDSTTSSCVAVADVGIGPIYTGPGTVPECPPGSVFDINSGLCIPFGVVIPPSVGIPPPPPVKPPPRGPTLTVPPPRIPQQLPPPVGTAPPFPPTAPINVFGSIAPIIPGFTQATGPTVSTTTTSGTTVVPSIGLSPVIVNVDQAVTLSDNSASNAVQSVANAVYAALQEAAGLSQAAQGSAISAIGGQLTSIGGAITQGIASTYGILQNVLNGIEGGLATGLGGIGDAIGNSIFQAVNPATVALASIAATIAGQIGGLAGAIAKAVAAVIPAIVTAISLATNPLGTILSKIEQDIGTNLASLTQLPPLIAGIPSGIDLTLNNIWSEYTAFTEQTTGYGTGETLHNDLAGIVAALTGLSQSVSGGVAPKLSDQVHADCPSPVYSQMLNNYLPVKFTGIGLLDRFISDYFSALGVLISWFYGSISALEKSRDISRQRIDSDCPISPLPIGALVDATTRGYLDEQTAIAEAAKNDLSESRFHTLRDLATHQFTPPDLTEAYFRGIINQQDYFTALQQQGFTGPQQLTQQALGVNRLNIEALFDLARRGVIQQDTLKTALKALQYDDTQVSALAGLAFRPATMNEEISGDAAQDLLNGLGIAGIDNVAAIPEDVQAAAAAEGLDINATQARWAAHWQVGGLATWITLYFRGQVTYEQVQAVMDRDFIPRSVQRAFIDSARPLVQFRTISTMLNQKIISEGVARQLLAQHGYTPNNVDILIAYAERPSKVSAAKNARAQQNVALSIAKEEFIDGSISGDQYLAILTQHGYTVDGANTELQVVEAHQAMLQRKANAQLVVDEYGAGLINEKEALAQLFALGLTNYEIARYEHRIRAFKAARTKIPSESDLNHMFQLGIITNDEYVQALEAQGYPEAWANNFLAWRQHPTSTAVVAVGPIPPPRTR